MCVGVRCIAMHEIIMHIVRISDKVFFYWLRYRKQHVPCDSTIFERSDREQRTNDGRSVRNLIPLIVTDTDGSFEHCDIILNRSQHNEPQPSIIFIYFSFFFQTNSENPRYMRIPLELKFKTRHTQYYHLSFRKNFLLHQHYFTFNDTKNWFQVSDRSHTMPPTDL